MGRSAAWASGPGRLGAGRWAREQPSLSTRPAHTNTRNDTIVPPPAIELIIPAANAAPAIATSSQDTIPADYQRKDE